MKNLARCFLILIIMSLSSKTYAQNWIPYQQVIQPAIEQPIVYVIQPQPVVVYQWTPYIIQQNLIIEQQCLFRRTQTVINKPVTQWILQPVVLYR